MKVLITGTGGQLGRELLSLGESYDTLDLVGRTSVELDITNQGAVMSTVAEEMPGVIINASAYTAVDKAEQEREKAYKVNARGAGILAEAARAHGALLIHISTDFVFDGQKCSPYLEDDKANPLGEYAWSKLKGEGEVIAADGRYLIFRTSWLYGLGGKNFVNTIMSLASERETLRVVYDQLGTPTWTGDLAHALLLAASYEGEGEGEGEGEVDALESGIYHFTNEGVASWYDFAVAVIEEATALGFEFKCEKIMPIRTSEYTTPALRPSYSILSKDKVKRALGITIPHWRKSLRKMLKEEKGAQVA